MTRGNQREIDRQRAAKRNAGKNKKSGDDGLTPAQRKERDAQRMREKQQAAKGGK